MIYGDEYSTWATQPGACDNCGKETEDRVFLEDWQASVCQVCAEVMRLTDEAEQICPVLHGQVIEANSVEEIRVLLRSHSAVECVECGSTRKTVQSDREMAPAEAARCEEEAS